MATLHETAYPRLKPDPTAKELEEIYTPTAAEIAFAKQLTTRSLPEIGRKFGGRDHSTVIHAVRLIEELRSRDADMDGDVDLPELTFTRDPLCIVVGSEGKGLSRLISEKCDQIVSIPMSSSVESLNAGLAAGVTLYEIARLRTAQ